MREMAKRRGEQDVQNTKFVNLTTNHGRWRAHQKPIGVMKRSLLWSPPAVINHVGGTTHAATISSITSLGPCTAASAPRCAKGTPHDTKTSCSFCATEATRGVERIHPTRHPVIENDFDTPLMTIVRSWSHSVESSADTVGPCRTLCRHGYAIKKEQLEKNGRDKYIKSKWCLLSSTKGHSESAHCVPAAHHRTQSCTIARRIRPLHQRDTNALDCQRFTRSSAHLPWRLV